MDPIDRLVTEHRVIERVLDALDAWSDRVALARADQRPELARFVRFLREFADARHHGKEEDLLFRAMIDHGFPREHGPIAVMLHEHDRGRALVRALADLAAQPDPWDDRDRDAIGRAASEFTFLLRQHIEKEDSVLYPMAQARLPAAAIAELGRRFGEVDPRTPDELDALGEALAALG